MLAHNANWQIKAFRRFSCSFSLSFSRNLRRMYTMYKMQCISYYTLYRLESSDTPTCKWLQIFRHFSQLEPPIGSGELFSDLTLNESKVLLLTSSIEVARRWK